jgi:hypothetical protein
LFNLPTRPFTRGTTLRRLIGTVASGIRSVTDPAGLIADQTNRVDSATVAADPDPAGLFAEDELPAVEDIERAAFGYDLAADSARSADRAKRKHRKLLDRIPAGQFGNWLISREPSNRQVADLDQIRAIFKQHDLGEVPMRGCAPSLKVERAIVPAGVITEQVAA